MSPVAFQGIEVISKTRTRSPEDSTNDVKSPTRKGKKTNKSRTAQSCDMLSKPLNIKKMKLYSKESEASQGRITSGRHTKLTISILNSKKPSVNEQAQDQRVHSLHQGHGDKRSLKPAIQVTTRL